MWVQKVFLKHFSKLLVLFLSLLGVSSAVASDISPFYFAAFESTQENEWQKLMKYKLWGTGIDGEGVTFNSQEIFITDSIGYSGSATGDLRMGNVRHAIGGPLAFGGGFRNGDGEDTLLTGPSHFGGAFNIGSNAYGNNNLVFSGVYCSDANGYNNTDRALLKGGGKIDCNDPDIPVIDSRLDVPLVDFDNWTFSYVHNGDWVFSNKVERIEIPNGSEEMYDILVTGNFKLDDGNDSLYIVNPYNRNVRIFVKGSIIVASTLHNVVVMDKKNQVVSNADYAGNLLFYTPNDISFPAEKCLFQGTYISGGTISFRQHYKFAGQLLAKKIYIEAEFDAGDFRYVQFMPAVLMSVNSMAYEDNEVVGDTVKLELSKAPATKVTFDYCFAVKDASFCDGYKDDPDCLWANVNDISEAFFDSTPLCGRDTAHAVFNKNDSLLSTPIIFHAKDDSYEEDDERVTIKVFNLTAAVTPNGNRDADASYSMNYIIVDNDKKPVSYDTVVIVKVNEVLTIDKFPAYSTDSSTVVTAYNVIIRELPDVGALKYKGNSVAVGDTIKADATTGVIDGLTYTPETDSFGSPYASLGFDICKSTASDLCDTAKTMTINVVNVEFLVRENAPVDTLIGVLNDMRIAGTLKCSIESGNTDSTFTFGKGTELVLNSKLDYETTPSYGLVVKCSNGTEFDSTVVSIIVIDVNEASSIRDTVFHVSENMPVGTRVDSLPVYDEDKNPDFRQNTLSLIGGDVKKYAIDKNTGVITTLVVLDYEADNCDTLWVLVEDSDDNKDTAMVVILVDNIVEIPTITITEANTRDTTWLFPRDTLYINRTEITLSWEADNIPQPDTTVKNLHEGYNTITLSYYDKTQDRGTVATIVIFVCTRTPEVSIIADVAPVVADNIYTIVEQVDKNDTSYYVNKKDTKIVVELREPILNESYTDSTCNYDKKKMSIDATLDTLKVSDAEINKMGEIVKANIALDLKPAMGATVANANDSLLLVTYKTMVGKDTVTVSYYTNADGDVLKNADGNEVMTVSYKTKDSKGNPITISYQANAVTGALIEQWEGAAYAITYPYKDKKGNQLEISYFVTTKGKVVKNEEGNTGYQVSYEYTNEKFGNTAKGSIFVVVDTIVPVVEILSPADGSKVTTNFVTVEWTVNGQVQDTLTMQGLVKGANAIIRYYRDKAGNFAGASIVVVLKNPKDIAINVEKPVTVVTEDRLNEYYSSDNQPKPNQTMAVSVYNNKEGVEEEVLIGGNMKNKAGSGKEPYEGKEDHLGPTLTIDLKLPIASAIGGLATMDDIIGSDGLVSLDGVDAEGGTKMAPQQYVEQYCTDEFKAEFGGDLSKLNLYDTEVKSHVWIYTNLGSYVDDYTFSVDMNNPDYANKAGMASVFFELKPDVNGNVRTKSGKLMATGAYVYKVDVSMNTKLRCTLPPIVEDMPNANKKGAKRTVSDDMLRPFGYKRPPVKK